MGVILDTESLCSCSRGVLPLHLATRQVWQVESSWWYSSPLTFKTFPGGRTKEGPWRTGMAHQLSDGAVEENFRVEIFLTFSHGSVCPARSESLIRFWCVETPHGSMCCTSSFRRPHDCWCNEAPQIHEHIDGG